MLLVVFMTSYGVASQTLIDPYRDGTGNIFRDVLHKIFIMPYWQMFGELSLDTMKVFNVRRCPAEPSDSNNGFCYPTDSDSTQGYHMFVDILLAIYLLLSNVILLNLLIAVFTSIFDKVHSNSLEVWKWEMYQAS